MKLLKSHPILSIANSFVIDSPSNLSYLWNYGSLLRLCLVMQIITGVTLAMHSCSSIPFAFLSVEHMLSEAEFVYNFILSNFTVSCDGATDLPYIMQFDNLHITENLSQAVKTLKGTSGIYCITHPESGQMYIGSSVNLGNRITAHFVNGSSNVHLQFAIAKYGLALFVFSVIELCAKDQLLVREQHWLNWLFSQSALLRYNFLPNAGSLLGYRHSEESKALISAAKTGFRHSEESKALMSGENHPNYGEKTSEDTKAKMSAANSGKTASEESRALMSAAKAGNLNASKSVSIYTLDGSLVQSFHSATAAALYLGVTQGAITYAIKRNSVVKRLYRVSFTLP